MYIKEIILLSAGIACLVCSCRSTGKELHRESKMEWVVNRSSTQHTEETRQIRDSLQRQTEQDTQETVWIRTTTVRYDTSAQSDSLHASYPILEQTVTCIEKNKTSTNRTDEHQGSRQQTRTQTDRQSEINSVQTSVEKSKQSAGSDPYRWRYIAIAGVLVSGLAACLIRKYCKSIF